MGAYLTRFVGIARSEARRYVSPDLPWLGSDDLVQEAMIDVYLAARRGLIDPEGNVMGYVRRTIRHCMTRQIAHAMSESRYPHNLYGAPLHQPFAALGASDMAVDIPEPPAAATPPCHARSETAEGYDRDDPLCHDCPDKFSCLVESAENGLVPYGVDVDAEVALVVEAAKSHATALQYAYETVTERQRRRIRLRTAGRPIPPELEPTASLVLPPEPELTITAPAMPGAASRGAPAPAEPLLEPPGLPGEKRLAPHELDAAIARIRIGQPFDLEIGHVLVRRTKGVDVCVEIRADGFWLNLNSRTYGSHSMAATAADIILGASPKSKRPGNHYFNLIRHHSAEIRDAATGAVLACRRGVRA